MTETYGDQVVTSSMLANPVFMLDMLIAHNDQEFFKVDIMNAADTLASTQDSTANTSGSPNRRGWSQGITPN